MTTPKIHPYNYTTIKKNIKEFSVIISDDPKLWYQYGFEDECLQFKNLFRVYCRHENNWVTFLMSQELLKLEPDGDNFIHTMLTRQFAKITNPQ